MNVVFRSSDLYRLGINGPPTEMGVAVDSGDRSAFVRAQATGKSARQSKFMC
jgi:hypothetical protein